MEMEVVGLIRRVENIILRIVKGIMPERKGIKGKVKSNINVIKSMIMRSKSLRWDISNLNKKYISMKDPFLKILLVQLL